MPTVPDADRTSGRWGDGPVRGILSRDVRFLVANGTFVSVRLLLNVLREDSSIKLLAVIGVFPTVFGR